MLRFKQKFLHNPPHSYGDCQRTAFACLLERDPETIPNFGQWYYDQARWEAEMDQWLARNQMSIIRVIYDCSLADVLKTQKNSNPGHYYFLSGKSKNGVGHVVIGLDDKIIWDPALDDSGIVSPFDDGYYYIEFLVPALHKS